MWFLLRVRTLLSRSVTRPTSHSLLGGAWPGHPSPLGATWDGAGVNFAVFSEHAAWIDVCFFDEPRGPERRRIRLAERVGHVHHGYVHGVGPGQLYGLRAHGAWDPERGHRFNASKLLVDPYARALAGKADHGAPLLGHDPRDPREDLVRDERDDAAGVPKAVVVDPSVPWEGDRRPATPWEDTVLYELHVKGFTARHPDVEPEVRGSYSALAHPKVIAHLLELGVTAIELLPVHDALDDGFLVKKGLVNYWGYNTLGFFAPDARFSSAGDHGGQVREFKSMVKALHAAGLEVILDVVYNHTCEGNQLGPTLSLRGLDNASYYRLLPGKPRLYEDFTGCGNSLDTRHPYVLQLVLDSLRYWVEDMHVDGFRFDLATTLARETPGYDKRGGFLDAVHADPVLSRVKLIAEPWDVGHGGYQVGNFPTRWSEWNGKYRDGVRRYWHGLDAHVKDLGYRLTGSSDLYGHDGRRPQSSINFVTSHDGFTLHDLVRYRRKHNEANQEGNRDGDDHNNSHDHGVEGESTDEAIEELRDRQVRNFLATLLVSQGVPMLLAGDELGRTQGGNNNAYCQDNEVSWVDWDLDERRRGLLRFVKRMVQLRKAHPVLRRRRFFQGVHVRGSELKDLAWFRPDGREMSATDWDLPHRGVALLFGGDAIPYLDAHGAPVVDDSLLIVLNGERTSERFRLPAIEWAAYWEVLVDTEISEQYATVLPQSSAASTEIEVAPLSLVVLRSIPAP
ncbi:MAG: glycogen debranching protein GlgX [Polyangiales bacterium]